MRDAISITRLTHGTFELRTRQWVPAPLQGVFAFFSEAGNLELLTPEFLAFHILTQPPLVMRQGLRIDYRIRLHKLPLRWRSEITCWNPPHRFVDEQVKGPYRTWRHEHTFEEQDGGTVVRDHVVYEVWGGALINRLFVEPDLRRVFAFRQSSMHELFGSTDSEGREPAPFNADSADIGRSNAGMGPAA